MKGVLIETVQLPRRLCPIQNQDPVVKKFAPLIRYCSPILLERNYLLLHADDLHSISQGVKRKLKGNVSNETKLLEAAFKGKDSVIVKLLKKQIDLNCRDVNEGDCPLHIAAENGHLEYCTTLIKNGANVNIQVSEKHKILQTVCNVGNIYWGNSSALCCDW